MSKDYYHILGINKDATVEEIKKAFRKKAHEHHPDKANGNTEKFKEVNEAYQVLGKPERKKQYDQFGTTFEGFGGQAAYDAGFDWADLFRQGGFGPSARDGFRTAGFNFNFSDLGDIFSDFFGGGRYSTSGRSRTIRGSDIEVNITIDFEEAVFGTEKTLDISKLVTCAHCQGNGAEPGTKIETCKTCAGSGQVTTTEQTFFGAFRSISTCPDCQGEGKRASQHCLKCQGRGVVRDKERIKVKIPAGIDNGETMRLSGKGEAGVHGGQSGDLYINISVKPSMEFERQGYDIYSTLKISYTQAALGDKAKVKTLDGQVNLKIPAGTPSGKQFILRDKGVPKLRGRGRGDHLVTVEVRVPKDLTRKQKKMLEEMQKEGL